jgi:hypothetical protein
MLLDLLGEPNFPWTQVTRGRGSQTVAVKTAVGYAMQRGVEDDDLEAALDAAVAGIGGRRVKPIYVPLSPVKLLRHLRNDRKVGDIYEVPASCFGKPTDSPRRMQTID